MSDDGFYDVMDELDELSEAWTDAKEKLAADAWCDRGNGYHADADKTDALIKRLGDAIESVGGRVAVMFTENEAAVPRSEPVPATASATTKTATATPSTQETVLVERLKELEEGLIRRALRADLVGDHTGARAYLEVKEDLKVLRTATHSEKTKDGNRSAE